MQAQVGDTIAVHGRHVGEHDRHGTITEVHGANGAPPYLVRWSDGKEATFFPSSDCTVEHREQASVG